MMTRHRYFFLILLAFAGTLLFLLVLGGARGRWYHEQLLTSKRQIVRELGLTDLALWTEARYTRHPSQTDFFSAFQDIPAAFEHFPAGSLVAPARKEAR